VLIEPSSTIHARHFASSIGALSRALQMESYPKFHNEVGVPIVRIGCREFMVSCGYPQCTELAQPMRTNRHPTFIMKLR